MHTMKSEIAMGSDVPLPRLEKATVEELGHEIIQKLAFSVGKDPASARGHDWLKASILVVRDRVIERWLSSVRETYKANGKRSITRSRTTRMEAFNQS